MSESIIQDNISLPVSVGVRKDSITATIVDNSGNERVLSGRISYSLSDNAVMKKELLMELWEEKPQTKAAVKNAIHDKLFRDLPYPVYEEADIELKTELVFDYLQESYRMAG